MSPKYWASSEDLSLDSSVEGSQDGLSTSRDHKEGEEEEEDSNGSELRTGTGSSLQDPNAGTVARKMGTHVVLPRLSNLEPHQHASLFYLSLIEGRCRIQAAHTINAARNSDNRVTEDHPDALELAQHLFAEMQRELVRAGMIPEEFAGSSLPDLRQYLNSFDTLLKNIATQRNFNLSEHHSHRALPGFESPSFNSNIASNTALFSYNPAASIRRKSIMPPQSGQLQRRQLSSKLLLLFPEVVDTTINGSDYETRYVQISELGKGGYGQVFRAKYILDGAEYAIKKIILKASYLRQLLREKKLGKVLTEIKVLARLDHHHIARYHHCWIETRPCGLPGDDNTSNSNSELSGTRSLVDSFEAITSGVESIQFGVERDLNNEIIQERRATLTRDQTDEASLAAIVFSESRSTKRSEDSRKAKDQDKSLKVTNSMFYKPGDDVDGSIDDSNVEEISRSEVGEASGQDYDIQEDAILFIKMTPYPLTLEEFMWADLQTTDKDTRIKHCFHPLPAVRILLAILEGVEYLHNKEIVHRDLKPKNIFLSILDPTEKPTQGYINIYSCGDCGHNKTTKSTFICPRIGDFGLVQELKYVDSEGFSAGEDIRYPFTSHNVGTTLYCPPIPPKEKAVTCEKLDVFSLGIIAFELVYHFGTDTERRVVLSKLGKMGEVPDDFKGHEMREGIQKMVCTDRSQRWGTTSVREWLEELKEKWE